MHSSYDRFGSSPIMLVYKIAGNSGGIKYFKLLNKLLGVPI